MARNGEANSLSPEQRYNSLAVTILGCIACLYAG